jgi:hypothetical protein
MKRDALVNVPRNDRSSVVSLTHVVSKSSVNQSGTKDGPQCMNLSLVHSTGQRRRLCTSVSHDFISPNIFSVQAIKSFQIMKIYLSLVVIWAVAFSSAGAEDSSSSILRDVCLRKNISSV